MSVRRTTLKDKLVRSNLITISGVFVAVLIVVSILSVLISRGNLAQTQDQIRSSLVAKGKTLVLNNSMALKGMAADNAIVDVRSTIWETVKGDKDMLYGVYMDAARKPWVVAEKGGDESATPDFRPLADTMSVWAEKAGPGAYKTVRFKGGDAIEFAAHVEGDDGVLGTIRYGLTTESMKVAIGLAQTAAARSLAVTILLLIVIAGAAILLSFLATVRQASTITSPVAQLSASAREIAGGNYAQPISAVSDDEIGDLSNAFETMRVTVKKFTEHLQDLVDEKMQQVRDIMNNIDQGLLTVNQDLSINAEYSAATNKIFRVDDTSKLTLPQLFRASDEVARSFGDWMGIVLSRYQVMRWTKLVRLSPVQDLELRVGGEVRYIRVNYQQVLDKSGHMTRVMLLAKDVTDQRKIEQRIEEERIRHENEVRTILGIVNNPSDVIAAFLHDTQSRIDALSTRCNALLEKMERARREYPEGEPVVIDAEQISALFRDFHTIKGNAGTYGFDVLSKEAHHSENILEELREPAKSRRADLIRGILGHIAAMANATEQIRINVRMLSGEGDDLMLKIPSSKVTHLKNICRELSGMVGDSPTEQLLTTCMQIDFRPFAFLVKRYAELVHRVADKYGKTIEFKVDCPNSEVAPNALENADEALVHLIRNAVDHGIETNEVRERANKGVGLVTLYYKQDKKEKIIRVADNGKGIDGDAVVARAVEKGFITQAQASTMSYVQKCDLVFLPGLSTAQSVTDLSGRGVGMEIVKKSVEASGGRISMESSPGEGTVFTISLPTKYII